MSSNVVFRASIGMGLLSLFCACSDVQRERDIADEEKVAPVHMPKVACPRGRDESWAYVTVGKTLFKLPRAPAARVHVSGDVRAATEQEDDLGKCVEKPRPVQNLGLTELLTAASSEPHFPEVRRVQDLALVGIADGAPALQDSFLYLVRNQSPGERCLTVPGGFETCGQPQLLAQQERPTAYRARLDVYTAPEGRIYVVLCGFGPSISSDDCRVNYRLGASVSLEYRFNRKELPLDKLIGVDRVLRGKVDALRVGEYR
ncbi:hypothetical protein J5226_13635 [Lysobacter sp. K5869]|uniref:hypothetical protein n=1 Tax=Lysobacter sp. K5869 TaxID=2820808 RepID=UPI001C064550|nr:hypothetical protein [Lysobacter sp. K5869]QWP74728.1 hypothetical protein J5226_13635 [Lysobacter sp. K5869]